MFSTVTMQVSLRVTFDIEPPHQSAALHRFLPHRRVDSLAAPRDLDRREGRVLMDERW